MLTCQLLCRPARVHFKHPKHASMAMPSLLCPSAPCVPFAGSSAAPEEQQPLLAAEELKVWLSSATLPSPGKTNAALCSPSLSLMPACLPSSCWGCATASPCRDLHQELRREAAPLCQVIHARGRPGAVILLFFAYMETQPGNTNSGCQLGPGKGGTTLWLRRALQRGNREEMSTDTTGHLWDLK